MAGFMIWFGDVLKTPRPFALGAQVVGIYLCSWSMLCLCADLWRRWQVDLRGQTKVLLDLNRAYLGAFVAHIGILVAILGFLGNYRGISTDMTINAGETKTFESYELRFNGITTRQEHNATLFEAVLKVSSNGEDLGTLTPAKSKYPTKPELLNEVGVRSTFWHDLYIVIADFDKQTGKSVTLQVHKNPTVRLVWISVVLMVLGGLIALSDRHRGQRSRDVVAGEWEVGGVSS